MDSRSIEEITLNEVLENTVKSYDKVLSSHEEILSAKAQLMENQLILLRKQIHIVSKDLEEIADSMSDNRLYDICRRLRNISVPPAARNKASKTTSNTRPASMIAPSSPRIAEVKRCSSESQHLNAVKVRKKSMTIERLEDRQFRARNSVCHVSQRDPKLDYQLSSDMLALQETSFAKKYGDPVTVIKAAITIQRCWRKHYLNKTFHRIKLETPYRTKSMNSKVKPVVKIRHISSSTENLADEVVRHQVADSAPTPDHQQSFKRNEFGRQIIGRSKTNRMVSSSSEFSFTQDGDSISLSEVQLDFEEEEEKGSLRPPSLISRSEVYKVRDLEIQLSEPADLEATRRRNTGNFPSSPDSINTFRTHANSWSNFNKQVSQLSSSSSNTCPSPLGERVSGDGAENPDPIETDSKPSKYLSPIAEKYGHLWSSTSKDPEQRQLCRNYKLGVHKFNKRPSHGVKHLTTSGVVRDSPHDIAAFLLNGKGLSLSQIGNFITDLRKPLSMAVLEEFMKQIDFTSLPFEQALRHFISKLRLPGEAQKIDKLMEAFAERYCECNPGTISDTQDTIYVLAFSVIILQTDLHNPQIKLHRKMDLESFVQNNRGIDNGNDLDRSLLEAIYEGVKKEPIISGRDHLDFLESIDKSIVGKKLSLMDPWRMLMMSTQLQEIVNKNEKAPFDKHVRHVFLFNDLLLVTKQMSARGKATTKNAKERVIATCSFQYRQHFTVCSFKAESFATQHHPFGIRIVDSYDENSVLLELSAYNEDDRSAFLNELAEVTWVYRALENDRIGTLGVSDKMGQSTLSLHSFNSDSDAGRRHTHTLGRRFFKSNIFKSGHKREALSPSSSLFYTQGIGSADIVDSES